MARPTKSSAITRKGEVGYWLRCKKDEVFVPIDQEKPPAPGSSLKVTP
jgi:hypothetical protein